MFAMPAGLKKAFLYTSLSQHFCKLFMINLLCVFEFFHFTYSSFCKNYAMPAGQLFFLNSQGLLMFPLGDLITETLA